MMNEGQTFILTRRSSFNLLFIILIHAIYTL